MSYDGLVYYLIQLDLSSKLTIILLLCLTMALCTIIYVLRWPCVLSYTIRSWLKVDYCFAIMSYDGLVYYLILKYCFAIMSCDGLVYYLILKYCFAIMSYDGLVYYLIQLDLSSKLTIVSLLCLTMALCTILYN